MKTKKMCIRLFSDIRVNSEIVMTAEVMSYTLNSELYNKDLNLEEASDRIMLIAISKMIDKYGEGTLITKIGVTKMGSRNYPGYNLVLEGDISKVIISKYLTWEKVENINPLQVDFDDVM